MNLGNKSGQQPRNKEERGRCSAENETRPAPNPLINVVTMTAGEKSNERNGDDVWVDGDLQVVAITAHKNAKA